MKINIIGAGVAGLSAGCYLQMSGFDTEIFESHSTFGGLCTSWQRGAYTFESGFQWLLGSGISNPFYHLWSELIDMEAIPFLNHEIWMEIELKEHKDVFGDNTFRMYTNLDRLEKYLISIAPEDISVIKKFILTIRRIQQYEITALIKTVPQLLTWYEKMSYIRYLPMLRFLNKVKKETNFSFASKLKSPFLKEAFRMLYDGDEVPMLVLTMPLAYNDLKGSGYPLGGAVGFVSHLEKKYLELGGKIRYNTEVEKILVENKHATGIQLKTGEKISSDISISAADWHFTVFKALDGKYVDKNILLLKDQKKLAVYNSMFLVSFGVEGVFSEHPHFLRYPLENTLVSPDGMKYDRMEVHINNYDTTNTPAGKTVISVSFHTKNADYWINMRRDERQRYMAEKQAFSEKVKELLEAHLPGIKEKIEVVDVVTPATFERYTNNWKGSLQGWLPGKNMMAQSPVKNELPGLKDFYFIGHWSVPGGGLPVALKSARDVTRIICHDKKRDFKLLPVKKLSNRE